MPVILHPDTSNLLLSHKMHGREQLHPLFLPFPAEQLQSINVPDLVNYPRFDSPVYIIQV